MYRAAKQLQIVHLMIQVNPVISLQANLNALNLFPFPPMIRAQLMLTFHRLMDWKRKNLKISPVAAALFYRVSLTAGAAAPATLASRLDYLIRYRDLEAASGEIESILAVMKMNAAHFAGTWLHDGHQGLRLGDKDRARRAVGMARKATKIYLDVYRDRHITEQIDTLEGMIND